AWYKTSGLSGPVRHNYIAYYLHEGLWYGVGETEGSGAVRRGLDALREAFLYTGEAKYARAGAILLDRIADVYPDFDWYGWTDWRGNNYRGAIVDPVWSTTMSDSLTRAYDAFLPIYNDPYVIKFLSSNGAIYKSDEDGMLMRDEDGNLIPVNLKDSPGALRKHIEDNILLQSFEFAKTGSIAGNIGTAQKSVMYAALALNRQPETGEMLDWIMQMGEMYNTGPKQDNPISGGAILAKLVDEVNRDGNGSENAAGYNNIWVAYFIDIADKLASYDGHDGVNLFENAKYRKMFLSQAKLLLGGYYTAQIGDYGSVGSKGMALYKDESIVAFKHTGDRLLARALYFYNGNTAEGLRGSIFDEDPEKIRKDIEKIIEEDGEFALGSDMMTGFGFAALRDGAKYNSASVQTEDNTNRDFAIYFGSNNGHGHYDTLNLFMSAFGLNVAPDFGYPEFTGSDPNRVQWIHTTLSHNTVVVDEKEQNSASHPGVPYHFDDSGRVKVMDVDASKVYKNCDEYRRTVIMVEADDRVSYGVDFFHILGGSDHLYSFHSQSNDITAISGLGDMIEQPTYEAENGDLIGTYAGADVKYGPDPNSVGSEKYPKGYTWLKDVRTFGSIEKDFSVEYKVKDWRKALSEKKDIRLRVTMLGEEPVNEVSFATALPQFADAAGNKDVSIDYMLVRRKGANLESTFTTVYEPYEAGNKYIEKTEKVSMERSLDDKPGMNDAYGAVKVTLANGRVDYVIYSTNGNVKYVVDDKIEFSGFAGVLTLDADENVVYRYLNDGTVLRLISDAEVNESVAAYTGVVTDFTEELVSENYITFKPDAAQEINAENLSGRYVYIENDGVQNGAYKIESACEKKGNIELYIGDVSVVRSYVDPYNTDLGYVYNISENSRLRIPLTSVEDTAPVVENVSDATATAESLINIQLQAESPVGKNITFIGASLPRGVVLDEAEGKITWKPASSQVGENHFAVTVSDGTLETTVHFTVEVFGKTTGGGSGSSGSTGNSGTTTPTIPATPGATDKPAGSTDNVGAGVPDGPQTPSTTERFVDLGNHAWAKDAINSLADEGIIKGTSENTFSPAANITRADFAILLVRAFELASENSENFADV
ncbi:MAG: S-layer homology domain-containing protein, partial [Clostridia bacterium]|nr:S-layer homology domain-containing protein [Clostridia bacterium]